MLIRAENIWADADGSSMQATPAMYTPIRITIARSGDCRCCAARMRAGFDPHLDATGASPLQVPYLLQDGTNR